MSEENVEIVKRMGAAFNESGVEAASSFFADDAVFQEPPEQPAPRVAHGREAILDLFGQFDEAWAEHKHEQEDVRAIGPDRVLVLSIERFVGRDDIELASPAAHLFTLRDRKIVLWQAFWDRERALGAAGLRA